MLAPWTRKHTDPPHRRLGPSDLATRTAYLRANPITPELQARYTGERIAPVKRDKAVPAIMACPCAGAQHVVCLPARQWAAFVKPVRTTERESYNRVHGSSLSDTERTFRRLAETIATCVDEATVLDARRESLAMLRAAWAPKPQHAVKPKARKLRKAA